MSNAEIFGILATFIGLTGLATWALRLIREAIWGDEL